MKRFKNILAVYDRAPGNESTLRRATTLAQRNGARLTVLEVIEESEYVSVLASILSEQQAARILAERWVHLDRFVESIRHKGIQVRAEVVSGTPFLSIIQTVLRGGHDLVIMTAEAEGEWKKVLFGSTSMHLMRKCPCPVWITDPDHKSDNYNRVLVAVDTSTPGEENEVLNTVIMDLATSLARLDRSELHIVHAWELNKNDEVAVNSEITPATEYIVDRLIKKDRDAYQVGVDALLGKYELEDLSCQIHLQQGRARSAIPQLAAEIQTDLLVMGTVCRTGIAGFFIGNTAEHVLRQVNCSVLTLKPPAFRTPVTLEHSLPRKGGAALTLGCWVQPLRG